MIWRAYITWFFISYNKTAHDEGTQRIEFKNEMDTHSKKATAREKTFTAKP